MSHPGPRWGGIMPAALTMFTVSGRLDLDATAAHIDDLVGMGADGLVVGGTSGEFIALSEFERRRLIETAIDVVGGRAPVIAGTGYFSTAATIRLTRHAAAKGADGAIVILPYFQKPNRAEVIEHYRAVGRSVGLPLMVYNNPANSAAPPLMADDIRRLYDEGCVHAVKSTFATVHQVHDLRAEIDDGLRVFYGSFMAPLEGMAAGAHGWISGILNVTMPDARDLWVAMANSDIAGARKAWSRIRPIRDCFLSHAVGDVSDLAIYKAILRIRGGVAGYCRPPIRDVAAAQLGRLAEILETVDDEAIREPIDGHFSAAVGASMTARSLE
ncbi:MAG: dihydrodipicolinate synthase family protein [Chloroflexi bacterium]|nr:dihydrodipicolinate synthase family protein [Chloroflexota bacterium]